jgi:hypothetical protein
LGIREGAPSLPLTTVTWSRHMCLIKMGSKWHFWFTGSGQDEVNSLLGTSAKDLSGSQQNLLASRYGVCD